jgi:hypothetical protein
MDTTFRQMLCPADESCAEYARLTRVIENQQRVLAHCLGLRDRHAQLPHGVWRPAAGEVAR